MTKNDTSVLILAAGEHSRWEADYPKQLAKVDGEPLLLRTIRQLNERNHYPIVVTHLWRIGSALGHTELFNPSPDQRYMHDPDNVGRTCTADTLLSCHAKFFDKTVVLLGDVIFSDDAISTIVDDEYNYAMFYGNFHDIFAVTFPFNDAVSVANAARNAINYACRVKDMDCGKLWQVYRAYCIVPMDKHNIESRHYSIIDDWTNDIDTLEDYEEMLRMLHEKQ